MWSKNKDVFSTFTFVQSTSSFFFSFSIWASDLDEINHHHDCTSLAADSGGTHNAPAVLGHLESCTFNSCINNTCFMVIFISLWTHIISWKARILSVLVFLSLLSFLSSPPSRSLTLFFKWYIQNQLKPAAKPSWVPISFPNLGIVWLNYLPRTHR